MNNNIINSKNTNNVMNNECSKFSIFPQVIRPVKRIIAIGDIHGDFNYLIYLLKIAFLINNSYDWVGGDTYLVQLGDQIDSCRPYYKHCNVENATQNDNAEDTKIIKYLDNLHIQAKKHGGAVISLMGNHELMNLTGDMSYVSYQNLKEFDNNTQIGMEKRMIAFGPDGDIGRKLICTHPPAVIIGTNLFVHAGILPTLLDSLPEFRDILKEQLIDIINDMLPNDALDILIRKILDRKINIDVLTDILQKKTVDFERIKIKHAIDPKSYMSRRNIFFGASRQSVKTMINKIIADKKSVTKLLNQTDKIKKILIENLDIFGIDELHPIEVINTIVRKWLLQKINRHYLGTIEPTNAIFWNRILGSIPNEKFKNVDNDTCEKYVKPVLQFLNVNKMIIGHTPQFIANQSGMNSACGNSVIRIDTGGSKAFNSFDDNYMKTGKNMKQRVPQVLEIINDTQSRILYDTQHN